MRSVWKTRTKLGPVWKIKRSMCDQATVKMHQLKKIGSDSRNKAQPINTTSFSSLAVHPEILARARVTADA